MDLTDPRQNPNRARELLAELGEKVQDPTKPPLRPKSYVSYIDDPERAVEVPYRTAADVLAAEETLGIDKRGEPIPFAVVGQYSKTEAWMIWRALSRHRDEAERPTTSFEDWRETVDQMWDDGNKLVPLAAAEEVVNRLLRQNQSPPPTDE